MITDVLRACPMSNFCMQVMSMAGVPSRYAPVPFDHDVLLILTVGVLHLISWRRPHPHSDDHLALYVLYLHLTLAELTPPSHQAQTQSLCAPVEERDGPSARSRNRLLPAPRVVLSPN